MREGYTHNKTEIPADNDTSLYKENDCSLFLKTIHSETSLQINYLHFHRRDFCDYFDYRNCSQCNTQVSFLFLNSPDVEILLEGKFVPGIFCEIVANVFRNELC